VITKAAGTERVAPELSDEIKISTVGIKIKTRAGETNIEIVININGGSA